MNPIPPSIDGKMNHWPGATATVQPAFCTIFAAAAVRVHHLPCFFLAPSESKDKQRQAKGKGVYQLQGGKTRWC